MNTNFVPRPPKLPGPRIPTGTQADRIFAKFGGVPALCRALKNLGPESARSLSAIYRWNLPKYSGGSDGVIPTANHQDILKAARLEGIVLTPEDWFPGKDT